MNKRGRATKAMKPAGHSARRGRAKSAQILPKTAHTILRSLEPLVREQAKIGPRAVRAELFRLARNRILTPRQRYVLIARLNGKTVPMLSGELGERKITNGRVRQIEGAAISKLFRNFVSGLSLRELQALGIEESIRSRTRREQLSAGRLK